jgi:hypothetical protein
MRNTPTLESETADTSRLRRDHPVLHPGLIYADGAMTDDDDVRAAHEGYAGLEADDDLDAGDNVIPRRGVGQRLRQQQEDFQEMLRGWASL